MSSSFPRNKRVFSSRTFFLLPLLFSAFIGLVWGQSARYTVYAPNGWATIRNAPGEYAIGNSGNQWTFDVDYTGQNPWYYGHLYGDANMCGWMLNNDLENDNSAGNALCSSSGTEFPLSSFASWYNSEPPNDGASTTVQCQAASYANIDPMGSISPVDYVREYSPGTEVLWRWVSLDGNWVMVRDPAVADGYGDWIFIARYCLPADLPYATQV